MQHNPGDERSVMFNWLPEDYEVSADDRLRNAAPDMLETLKAIAKSDAPTAYLNEFARAAISKATGKGEG